MAIQNFSNGWKKQEFDVNRNKETMKRRKQNEETIQFICRNNVNSTITNGESITMISSKK